MSIRRICQVLALFALLPANAGARVVINEVFYNAPNDLEDLEFIELHNSAKEPADLSGWSIAKGIKFKFPSGAKIEANGFLVLCRNAERFKESYDAPIAGTFKQALSNKGDRLELVDASDKVVDSIQYSDEAPWPMGADGFSGSLERISPEAPGEDTANWASSPLSSDRLKPSGTPGRANANYSPALPPIISNVLFAPENPSLNEPISVEADVRDAAGVADVKLLYRLAGPGFENDEIAVAMRKVSAIRYVATIPGLPTNGLVRFRLQASNSAGARRFFPAEHEPRPALSSYVHGSIESAQIPFAWIIDTTQPEFQAAQQRARVPGGRGGFPGGFRFDGAPPAAEIARVRARMMVQTGLDLSGAWFELTAKSQIDLATVQKLKPVFARKLSERDKLIDDTADSSKIEEKLQTLPDTMATFQSSFAESLKPFLSEAQFGSLTAFLNSPRLASGPGSMPVPNPGMMIKARINLEEAWQAISVKADLEEGRFAELRKTFQDLAKERDELMGRMANAIQDPESFRDIRERGDALDQKLAATIKPLLTAAQAKQFDDWRGLPAGIGPARRGGPGGPGGPDNGPGPFAGRGGGAPGGPEMRGFFGRGRGPAPPTAHRSAFIYFDPAKQKVELFDFVQVVSRSGGQKVHLYKDKPLNQMTTINLIFEFNEKSVLAESLAYEVYRRAGMAAPLSYHVRLWLNGQPLGYYLAVEQPNRAFLRRNNLRDDGNLYKLLWYERGVVGQHEKKTNPNEGHEDVVALIGQLQKTSGEEQWKIIEKHFDVPQVANYFAVNTVLSHWDGFFNNYFTYHDVKGSKKWTMYPWDQDQTWGIVMGPGEVFFNMPITFGMNGDAPPGQRAGGNRGGGFGFGFGGGGAMWWRQPGFFSGPLLANPQFRKLFLARTREILLNIYTEEAMGPLLESLGERLRPEVKLRAELQRSDPERAVQTLEQNLEAFREHVKKRREFLLAQDEIKDAHLQN